MKVSSAATFLFLATVSVDAFTPVRPSIVRSIVFSDAQDLNAMKGYLDTLEPPTVSSATTKRTSGKKETNIGGYLDNLTVVSGGRPILTGAGAADAPASYMDNLKHMNTAASFPSASKGASSAVAPRPVVASTDYMASLKAMTSNGAAKPAASVTSSSRKTAAPSIGFSYLSALNVNTVRGNGAGQVTYTSSLGTNGARVSGSGMSSYASQIGQKVPAPTSGTSTNPASVAPSTGGNYLSALNVNTVRGTGAGQVTYTSALSKNTVSGSGAGLANYASNLGKSTASTGAGVSNYASNLSQSSPQAQTSNTPTPQGTVIASGNYLSALNVNGVRGTGAGQVSYTSGLHKNSVSGTGAGLRSYTSGLSGTSSFSTEPSPKLTMSSTNNGNYLSSLASNAANVYTKVSGMGNYLESLTSKSIGRTIKSSSTGPAGYLDTLTKNISYRTGGAGLGSYLDNLASQNAVLSLSVDSNAEEYLAYLRTASKAAKDYLNYLEDAVASAKGYVNYFEKTKRSIQN